MNLEAQALPHEPNALGQPVGFVVPGWKAPPRPERAPIQGRYCRLEPLVAARHADALYAANALDTDGRMWTYMSYGPFDSAEDFRAWVEEASGSADPLHFAIVERASGKAAGVATHMRIDPKAGTIEVGGIAYSPLLQRTRAATEAMFLMMRTAFSLGYRRYEWKCNALNAASRAAAQRLGFSYEGIFRQHMVVKGRNRDTAWYSIIDSEWPALERAYEQWLAPGNFDAAGQQKVRLSDLTGPLLKARG